MEETPVKINTLIFLKLLCLDQSSRSRLLLNSIFDTLFNLLDDDQLTFELRRRIFDCIIILLFEINGLEKRKYNILTDNRPREVQNFYDRIKFNVLKRLLQSTSLDDNCVFLLQEDFIGKILLILC